MENNPFIFNASPLWLHVKFLSSTRFVRWLGNTAFVGVIVVAITLLLAVLPRMHSPGSPADGVNASESASFYLFSSPTLLFIPFPE